jgi:multimeric flavodoxin WrbA
MKIYAINGGPRKKWNTATMLDSFIKGVESCDPNIEVILVNLYDLNYKGCISCYACKLKNGASYGKCGFKDDIHQLLIDVSYSDGVVFASPVYFGDVTAQLRGFLERLMFPYTSFEKGFNKIAPKKIQTAMIYTMNVKEPIMFKDNYDVILGHLEHYIGRLFTKPQVIYAFNTYEFYDYSKYEAEAWDEQNKAEYKRIQFPKDCDNAFNAGRIMVENIKNSLIQV